MLVSERCDFNPGDKFDGEYRIERCLGEGSFGIVYKAKDSRNKDCAIKLLKLWAVPPDVCANLQERFKMEFETGRIISDNLVHSYTHGEVKGNPYITMEYCSNGDLRSYVSRNQVDFFSIGRQILQGLADLHSCGKVHRDLKPENVLLRSDNTAVLTDFGISGDQNKRMTERGISGRPQQIFGTYPYMPPEQVNPPRGGQATVLPTTDIFSFGVMMYELMVGTLPFGPLSNDSELARYLHNGKNGIWNKESLRNIKDGVIWQQIIDGCLKPDFRTRIQSAGDVLKLFPEGKQKEKEAAPKFEARNGFLLRVMQGEEYGNVILLEKVAGSRKLLSVGRDADECRNDIPIREIYSRYVSRRHCTLEKDDISGLWYIRDGQWTTDGWKNSLNGTYVNSREADIYGIPINLGDIISIGDVKLRVEGY